MDFDTSKENIQPLRGGRNVAQLGVALQAQSNQDYQRELQMQRQQLEEAIRTYEGPDPLENWYNFIYWVEQSYPKHGHEGNLVPLLEDCLTKFENDARYVNDPRFCKLWIKFIDLQQNPIELYQMMHARALCRKCTEMYRAWAYYHEAIGDFAKANDVFELGLRENAQPFNELSEAYHAMIVAAGRQKITGSVDERRLVDQRQALTCLHSHRTGRVSSIRSGSSVGGVFPSASSAGHRFNAPVNVYEDTGEEVYGAAAAVPVSILSVARKSDHSHKENMLKPGPWTSVPHSKHSSNMRQTPGFVVHEDEWESTRGGIRLPKTFSNMCVEDYSSVNWQVTLFYPDPDDTHRIPMYPKHLVYADASNNNEYSIEEIRSTRYFTTVKPATVESEEAVLSMMKSGMPITVVEEVVDEPNSLTLDWWKSHSLEDGAIATVVADDGAVHLDSPKLIAAAPKFDIFQDTMADTAGAVSAMVPFQEQHHQQLVGSAMRTPLGYYQEDEVGDTGSRSGFDNLVLAAPQQAAVPEKFHIFEEDTSSNSLPLDCLNETCSTQAFNLNAMHVSTPQGKLLEPIQQYAVDKTSIMPSRKSLFSADADDNNKLSIILEDTKEYRSSSSGSSSSMKTANILSQTKPLAVISENSYESMHTPPKPPPGQDPVLGNLWNTPLIVRPDAEAAQNWDAPSDEYQFNLSQNLKANEALRLKLLGTNADSSVKMDCDSLPSMDAAIKLSYVPSDPFSPALLNNLLQHINFPSLVHQERYVKMNVLPRVQRKEVAKFADKHYSVEKVLGKGTYGSVFKALNLNANQAVALKHQKPPNRWEFYILSELRHRLRQDPLWDCFMDVQVGYFSDAASVLVSEFNPNGSLLDLVNKLKQKTGRGSNEIMALHFASEMLKIVGALHQAKVIHADIKPDNWLVVLSSSERPTLQLIDFGCSIDMALFPDGAAFSRKITTENFICPEMLEGRPWNYHTDLFCVAACSHLLLFHKYMDFHKVNDSWCIKQKMPRYLRTDIWNTFFSTLLNLDAHKPSADSLRNYIDAYLFNQHDSLTKEWRAIANIVMNR